MKKLKSVLGALAPTLGAAVGGPLGGQAGAIISKVLGVPNNPKSIETAMNNITSEQMVALKKAEKDFELQMKQLEVDIYKLETEDIQDAREKFSNDWTPKFLGILSVLGFFGYIGLVTIYPQPDESDDIVLLVIGSITGIATAVISFYFGSSNKK
jgi:hypothetical protein|tara:strand:+ start:294 stop:758 length:465 start_codon:yes stop_codon:yes gene_type:complete